MRKINIEQAESSHQKRGTTKKEELQLRSPTKNNEEEYQQR